MTQKEIEELAGHRKVSPWVVKLVGDAVAKEREACAKTVETIETYEKIEKACFKFAAKTIRARGQA